MKSPVSVRYILLNASRCKLATNLPWCRIRIHVYVFQLFCIERVLIGKKKKRNKKQQQQKKHLPVHAQKPISFAFEKFSQKIASVDHYLSPNLTGWCFSVHFHITKGSLSSTIRKSKVF